MKICERHSNDLRAALRKRGMGHLFTTEPALVRSRAINWLKGGTAKEEFDPYIVAFLEINAKAARILPREIASAAHLCPICQVAIKLQTPTDKIAHEWVENFSDLMLAIARKNEIVAGSVIVEH